MHRLADIFLSLLPERYRRRYQTDPAAGTFHSGVLQVLIAFVTYALLFLRYLGYFGPLSGAALYQSNAGGMNVYWASFGVGAISWLSFTLSPGPLVCMYFMIEGMLRIIAGLIVLEPVASLPFFLIGQVHDAAGRVIARRRLPPPAPDLVEMPRAGCGWDIRVVSVRKKEDWHSLVQIDYNGTLYHIARSGEEQINGSARFVYCLKRSTDVGAFRGIVKYDPFAFWEKQQ